MNNKVMNLLDQIIEKAKQDDEAHKARAIAEHNASQSLGEGWMVFHLKALKELMTTDTDEES